MNNNKQDLIDDVRILVIDDQSTMRKIVSQLLFQIGKFNISEASNGLQAMKLLNNPGRSKRPDVIISDLHMDGMDGIELCNKIRLSKIPGVRDIPVLMLTGESDDFILKVSKQVGVFKILSKPIGAPELKKHISSALGYQI
ncbi:MAG: response regulator [Kordiimonadaceae bacterium]|nr:response regulator [Kordiimonadaceae bacterium]MBT6035697.1 response regulator [Kordiimonadaceae bacterium]MBT6328685.1 response regulator [Kordiimonadaceae bacterium]MBT7581588.1 response regulator [Kordiimonadaceae bacterium]